MSPHFSHALAIPIPIPSLPVVLIIGSIALIAWFVRRKTSSGPDNLNFYHDLAGVFSLKSNWMTFILFLALLIAYIAGMHSIAGVPDPMLPNLLTLGAVSRIAVLRGEWYRLFTAPFLHAGLLHFFFNSIAFFYASRILEYRIGRRWLLAIFFVSALCGTLLSVTLNARDTLSVGASGAIMGMFAAILVLSLHANSTGHRFNLFYVALRVLVPSLLPIFFHSDNAHVDYAAHLGGFIGGGLCALLMLLHWPADAMPGLQKVATGIAAVLITLTILSFFILLHHSEFRFLDNCLHAMDETARKGGMDAEQYIKENSDYLKRCVKYYQDSSPR